MDDQVILIRFSVAFVASFLFGLARQRLGKAIGFGTFIFLALGSCALALTALEFNQENPLPLLGAIVTGIGFLGAGALFRTQERVVGFTSAATIWVFSVFGLCIGVGEFLIGGLIFASVWLVLGVDRMLESRWLGVHQRKLVVELALGTSDEMLAELGLPPRSAAQAIEVDREKDLLRLTYAIRRPRSESRNPLELLEASPRVRRTTVESA